MTDPAPEQTTADDLPETCPDCSEPLKPGFGLAGGGYGAYVYCERCGILFGKVQERTEPEQTT